MFTRGTRLGITVTWPASHPDNPPTHFNIRSPALHSIKVFIQYILWVMWGCVHSGKPEEEGGEGGGGGGDIPNFISWLWRWKMSQRSLSPLFLYWWDILIIKYASVCADVCPSMCRRGCISTIGNTENWTYLAYMDFFSKVHRCYSLGYTLVMDML